LLPVYMKPFTLNVKGFFIYINYCYIFYLLLQLFSIVTNYWE